MRRNILIIRKRSPGQWFPTGFHVLMPSVVGEFDKLTRQFSETIIVTQLDSIGSKLGVGFITYQGRDKSRIKYSNRCFQTIIVTVSTSIDGRNNNV